jgi:hypothetical protein
VVDLISPVAGVGLVAGARVTGLMGSGWGGVGGAGATAGFVSETNFVSGAGLIGSDLAGEAATGEMFRGI